MTAIKRYSAARPGLALIKTVTVGTSQTSTTVSDVFSSRYRNYKIMISGGSATTAGAVSLALGSANTGYSAGYTVVTHSTNAVTGDADNNATKWTRAGGALSNSVFMNVDLISPFLSEVTWAFGQSQTTTVTSRTFSGILNTTDSYTSFTVEYPDQVSSAVIQVYGYITG